MKSPSKTTSTYTSDSPMTEGYTQDTTQRTSQSTTPPRSTPSYYLGAHKGIEAFDVCMDFARDSYNIGVAIAYLLRAGKKPGNSKEQDIEKAVDHLNKELEYLAYDEYLRTSAEIAKNHKSK